MKAIKVKVGQLWEEIPRSDKNFVMVRAIQRNRIHCHVQRTDMLTWIPRKRFHPESKKLRLVMQPEIAEHARKHGKAILAYCKARLAEK
jgi:hypothetical protein